MFNNMHKYFYIYIYMYTHMLLIDCKVITAVFLKDTLDSAHNDAEKLGSTCRL